ncbi:MAG: S41 family peptidase [Actinomycetes bacterium]
MFSISRSVWRAVLVAMAVAGAFGLGVLTGVVGSSAPAPGVLDEAASRIASSAARPVDRQQLERAAVEGMLSTLDDRWSSYYAPNEFSSFEDALTGRYSGVGLWLRAEPSVGRAAGVVTIASVQPSSPADSAGLAPGDRLVAVDGRATLGARVSDVVTWLRGVDGSDVQLTVSRHGVTSTVTVRREVLTTDSVEVNRLQGGITTVAIHAFTRGVGREVRDALSGDQAAYSGGIVLDLRGNPGGLLDEAVEVASIFLDGGPVVSYERRGAPDRTLSALPGGDTTTPLVVLVDRASASAAEVVAAAMQDRNRAVIVGERTFGKGSVQEPSRLSDGSAIEFTVGRYLTPDGRVIDGHGVEPDVRVDPSTGSDGAESRALEVLRGLMAASQPIGAQG